MWHAGSENIFRGLVGGIDPLSCTYNGGIQKRPGSIQGTEHPDSVRHAGALPFSGLVFCREPVLALRHDDLEP